MRAFAYSAVIAVAMIGCMDAGSDEPAEAGLEIITAEGDPSAQAAVRLPRPGEVYSVCGYTLCMDGWVDLHVVSDPACGSGLRTFCHPCGGGYPQPECR
jgi:hypothetical protein